MMVKYTRIVQHRDETALLINILLRSEPYLSNQIIPNSEKDVHRVKTIDKITPTVFVGLFWMRPLKKFSSLATVMLRCSISREISGHSALKDWVTASIKKYSCDAKFILKQLQQFQKKYLVLYQKTKWWDSKNITNNSIIAGNDKILCVKCFFIVIINNLKTIWCFSIQSVIVT